MFLSLLSKLRHPPKLYHAGDIFFQMRGNSTTDPSPMIQINDRQRFVKLTHTISQNQFTQSILFNA